MHGLCLLVCRITWFWFVELDVFTHVGLSYSSFFFSFFLFSGSLSDTDGGDVSICEKRPSYIGNFSLNVFCKMGTTNYQVVYNEDNIGIKRSTKCLPSIVKYSMNVY